jgi:hypothetical protein
MSYAGIALAIAIWIGAVALICRMLGFNRFDDDPNERDPYN